VTIPKAVHRPPNRGNSNLTLATLCGMLPDGLGLLVDGVDRVLGRPDSWYYGQYHHALLHGLPAAVAIPLALSFFAVRRVRMFVIGRRWR